MWNNINDIALWVCFFVLLKALSFCSALRALFAPGPAPQLFAREARETEALARMEKGDAIPDVVFSDIQMPGVSGLELAARMISIHPLQIVFFKNLVLTDFGFWLYYNCSKISASSKS